MTIYRGVSGVNREIKQQFRGVGGVNREIKEQYRGVGGVNRKVFCGELANNILYEYGRINQTITGGFHQVPHLGNEGYVHYNSDHIECGTNTKYDIPMIEINNTFKLDGYKTMNAMISSVGSQCTAILKLFNTPNVNNEGYAPQYRSVVDFLTPTTISVNIETLVQHNFNLYLAIGCSKHTTPPEDNIRLKIYKIWLE